MNFVQNTELPKTLCGRPSPTSASHLWCCMFSCTLWCPTANHTEVLLLFNQESECLIHLGEESIYCPQTYVFHFFFNSRHTFKFQQQLQYLLRNGQVERWRNVTIDKSRWKPTTTLKRESRKFWKNVLIYQ